MPSDDDELLTDEQLRRELGGDRILNRETTRLWRTKGYGPPYIRRTPSPFSQVYYRRSDVQKWLASRTFRHRAEEATAS
jgi:hypothetical protein